MTTRTAHEIIAAAKPREITLSLCLRGDLEAEHETATAELERLVAGARGATPPPEAVALAERIEALQGEMLDASVTFRFRALRRTAWDAFEKAHTGDDTDAEDESFAPDLIGACLVDPVLSPTELAELLDVCNEAQRVQLLNAAWLVNKGASEVPFSERASLVMQARAQK